MKSSDVIALLALIVSLGSGVFTFYQWKQTDIESRVVAAIDVSRKYSEDKDIPRLIQEYTTSSSQSRSDAFQRLLLRLNYIAYLANIARLDRNYLSLQISCDIKHIYESYQKKGKKMEAPLDKDWDIDQIGDMGTFVQKGHSCLAEGM
jgi:hypothetical protein